MRRTICIFLSAFIVFSGLCLCSCSDNKKADTDVKLTEKYDKLLNQFAFKGECYVTAEDKVIYNKGIGYSDKEKKKVNNEETVFFIASVTKQFTAAAVMLLQERGKLSVNDKLSEYFPEYKQGENITLDNMLKMRSGIPDYLNLKYSDVFKGEYNPYKHSEKENRKVIREVIFSLPLDFAVDKDFNYSNGNYFLLAEIIEKVSGKSYKDFLRKEFFDKLSMSSTGFIDDEKDYGGNFALPYNEKDKIDISYSIKGAAFGCANMVSNAVDLNKWAKGLKGGKVINENSFNAMIQTGKNTDYGYGLHIVSDKTAAYHAGNYNSYRSEVFISLDQSDFNCVILSNYSFLQVDYIAKQFKEYYIKRGNYGA